MCDSKWIFTEEQLKAFDRKSGNSNEINELTCRQDAIQLIQEMGQRLRVSQLCINSAIVYFHRFYVFHPFSLFHRHDIAAASFFLAAKVEEHPRKAIDVIKVLGILLEPYKKMKEVELEQKVKELILHENFLTSTLGFDFFVEHPHVFVVQAVQSLRSLPGLSDMGQIFYFMATNTLHLTKLCLKYPSIAIAASCIDITCRWKVYEIPAEVNGKAWFKNIDESLTEELLTEIRKEFFSSLHQSSEKTQLKIEAVMTKSEAPKPPVAHRSTKALQEKNANSQPSSHIPNQSIKRGNSKRPHPELSSRSKKTSSAENQQASLELSDEASKKRKFESSDEELHEVQRPHKMGKFASSSESLDNSPPKTESTLMNLNVKLTIVPTEDVPFQICTPPEDDLFNYSSLNAGC